MILKDMSMVPWPMFHRLRRLSATNESLSERRRSHAAHRQIQGHGYSGDGQDRVGHDPAQRQAVCDAQQGQGRGGEHLLRGRRDRLGHLRREREAQAKGHRGGGDLVRIRLVRSQGHLSVC